LIMINLVGLDGRLMFWEG